MTEINIDAVPENIHWGYLDAALKPIRTVESGDTVVLNTLPAALKEDLPPDASWLTADHKKALTEVPLGGPPGLFVNGPVGPHMLTGPIYVNGAMPGDVLQIDILDAKPKQDWGFSAILPNLGTLPDEFTNYQRSHTKIDRNAGKGHCAWGSEVDLDPFFGIMAVAPPSEWGPVG
ncbi:MAG: amidase, partial [Oceanospirillales bacterium TMED59]